MKREIYEFRGDASELIAKFWREHGGKGYKMVVECDDKIKVQLFELKKDLDNE